MVPNVRRLPDGPSAAASPAQAVPQGKRAKRAQWEADSRGCSARGDVRGQLLRSDYNSQY